MSTIRLILLAALGSAFLIPQAALSQNTTHRDRGEFEAALGTPVMLEDFDGFSNGQTVSELFNGLITLDAALPTIFFGDWGTGGEFSGGAIIPQPRFSGTPLVLHFTTPVGGVGGNAFDDFDGSPLVNVITLTVTTTTNDVFSVSEDFDDTGDTGFLGAISSDGISKAEFSIDNTNGNLEVDLLAVPQGAAPVESSSWGAIKSLYR